MSDRPRIPDEEFALRRARLREELDSAGMDALVAYSDQHATFGQQNARYLFDYQPHFEACLVVVPREGEAFIATGPESEAFVRSSSRCDSVRIIDAFCHPDEEYPHSKIERLGDVMRGLGGSGAGIIGIAGGEFLPYKVRDSLRASTDAAFVEADAILTRLRAVKSAAEIAVLRHAYKIAQTGIEAALDTIAPGMTERAVAAEAEYAMRRMGSEGMGIDTIVGAGREHTQAILTRTTTRPIGAGDHVLLTLAPRYEGYHGAIARVAAVGAIDPEIERAMTVAIAAQGASAGGPESRRDGCRDRRHRAGRMPRGRSGAALRLFRRSQRGCRGVRAADSHVMVSRDTASGHGLLDRHSDFLRELGRAACGRRFPGNEERRRAPAGLSQVDPLRRRLTHG